MKLGSVIATPSQCFPFTDLVPYFIRLDFSNNLAVNLYCDTELREARSLTALRTGAYLSSQPSGTL